VFKDYKMPQTESDNVNHYRRMEASKQISRDKFVNLSKTFTAKKQAETLAHSPVILEKNCRISLNMNKFMVDKSRTHNRTDSFVHDPNSLDREQTSFSKPDHLV